MTEPAIKFNYLFTPMKLSGIRFRLLFLGIIPAFILTSALAYYFINHQLQSLETSLNERGDIITRQLATASVYGVFSGNHQILQELVDTILQEKGVVSVIIINQQNETLAKAQKPIIPDIKYLLNFSAPVVVQPLDNSDSSEDMLFDAANKISIAKNIGRVHIQLSLQNTLINQRTTLINSLLITFFGLLISALLAFRLGYTISLPIIRLTQAVNNISLGRLSTRADFKAKDEIEDLRRGFNVMAIGLEQTHRYLENQVENATSQLRKALNTLEIKNLSLEKAKDLAIAQNEIKSQFIAHISHEIRTPMNGILGFTDLLLKSNQTPQQIDHLQLIRNSAINLLSIVNEILEVSSLESGKFSLNLKPINLRNCLEDAVLLFSNSNSKVKLILDVDHEIPQRINNDPIRLQQIIANILNNAIKFTRQGHIVIRCRLLGDDPTQRSLFITVSDTGIGIAKTDQVRLFSPFLQLSPFAIDTEQGTGLGLSICKNIVARMQGTIGAVSAKGTGSTFWVNLPCDTCMPAMQATNNIHIVIIIAHKITRRAFKNQLLILGYRVYSYASISAFSSMDITHFNLFFIDATINQQQNLGDSAAVQFNNNSELTKKVIILTSNNRSGYLTPETTTLDLPCRSSYLSTLIRTQTGGINVIGASKDLTTNNQATINSSSILIADDNEINRLLLKSQFEQYYQHIDLAKNGREAFEYISTSTYNLIVLDLQMPELTGIELIKKVKTAHCRNANTPIIAITAHAKIDQRQKVIAAGFDDCLIKPILPEHFAAVIDSCLNKKIQMPTTNSLSATDYVQAVLAKTNNDKALANKLFTQLFEELPEQILIINQACGVNEISLATSITHKLHGSASFCGLSEIQNAARNLETTLSEKDIINLSINLEQLEKMVAKFLNDKQHIIKKLRV